VRPWADFENRCYDKFGPDTRLLLDPETRWKYAGVAVAWKGLDALRGDLWAT
jgi:hypothetical protein